MKKSDSQLPSLDDLQAKINEMKVNEAEPERGDASDMAQAMRFVVDIAAGALVGLVVGYFVDGWLGSMPLFTLVCFLFGVAAGVKNMMRSAAVIDKKLSEKQKENEEL